MFFRRLSVVLATAALTLSGALPPPENLPGSGPELEHDLPAGHHRLQLGERAPDFRLLGTDDRYHTLEEFRASPYLLVVFLSNHCPFCHATETRLLPWIEAMKARGLAVVAIQPNHPDALSIDELGFSKYSDSFPEMKLYAAEHHFTFPYLYDGETQAVAKAYGALATPDLFLFDAERRLCYSGRFDDSRFEEAQTVTRHDAADAFAALLAGRAPAVAVTRPMGCSVKWQTKIVHAAASNESAWEHLPISVEPIDAAGVAALVRNPGPNLRLINVWATWCGPCVAEMPELAKLSRRLRNRPFEVITLSLDPPAERAKVVAFLERRHVGSAPRLRASLAAERRGTNNYLYGAAGLDDLGRALDPAWPGPVPYTVLVAPGGKVLWRHSGAFDPVELSRVILDQLGGYYPRE